MSDTPDFTIALLMRTCFYNDFMRDFLADGNNVRRNRSEPGARTSGEIQVMMMIMIMMMMMMI